MGSVDLFVDEIRLPRIEVRAVDGFVAGIILDGKKMLYPCRHCEATYWVDVLGLPENRYTHIPGACAASMRNYFDALVYAGAWPP